MNTVGAQRILSSLHHDELLILHADCEGNALILEKLEPFLPNEFAISEEHPYARCFEERQIAQHQGDALLRRAIPGVTQKGPHERDAVAFGNHGEHEDVDVGFADLPVGPVHAEIPAVRIADQGHHDADAPIIGQEHLLEETLQATVGGRNLGASRTLRRNVGQVYCPGADHAKYE